MGPINSANVLTRPEFTTWRRVSTHRNRTNPDCVPLEQSDESAGRHAEGVKLDAGIQWREGQAVKLEGWLLSKNPDRKALGHVRTLSLAGSLGAVEPDFAHFHSTRPGGAGRVPLADPGRHQRHPDPLRSFEKWRCQTSRRPACCVRPTTADGLVGEEIGSARLRSQACARLNVSLSSKSPTRSAFLERVVLAVVGSHQVQIGECNVAHVEGSSSQDMEAIPLDDQQEQSSFGVRVNRSHRPCGGILKDELRGDLTDTLLLPLQPADYAEPAV